MYYGKWIELNKYAVDDYLCTLNQVHMLVSHTTKSARITIFQIDQWSIFKLWFSSYFDNLVFCQVCPEFVISLEAHYQAGWYWTRYDECYSDICQPLSGSSDVHVWGLLRHYPAHRWLPIWADYYHEFCAGWENHLNNTYCNPACDFPLQSTSRQNIIDIIRRHPDHDVVLLLSRKHG